jgi:carboxylesterase
MCCLLIHGLNAVPEHFDSLAQQLTQAGLTCRALQLPGHTGSTQALASATWTDWLAAVDGATQAAVHEHGTVILIGHSLGAALALAVAAREPYVSGVVALCPPLYLWTGERSAVCFLRHVLPFVPGWLHDVSGWRWSVTRQIRHACFWTPLRPVWSLIEALPALRHKLPQVMQPALVICARHDHAVPARDGMLTFELLGSTEKKLLVLEQSCHEVLHDVERPLVEQSISRFCIDIASRAEKRLPDRLAPAGLVRL